MSSLTRWRRHAHHGINRVGRDLGIPHKARVPVALALVAGAAFGGYWQYSRAKVGDTIVVDASALAGQVPGVTSGPVTAKVVSVAGTLLAPSYGVQPIVAGQQIPATLTVTSKSTGFKNTTPRFV